MMRLSVFLLGLVFQIAAAQGPRVISSGYPGASTAELRQKFDAELRSAQPNVVVLMAGANDALNDKKFLTPDQSGLNLEAMVARARSAGSKVILVTVHDPDLQRLLKRHRVEDYGDKPPLQRLSEVNNEIRQVSRRRHTGLVDFNRILASAGGANAHLSTDGVHLTAKGYGMLAAAVREKLPSHLKANDVVLCFGDSLTYGQGVRATNAPDNDLTYPSQLRADLAK